MNPNTFNTDLSGVDAQVVLSSMSQRIAALTQECAVLTAQIERAKTLMEEMLTYIKGMDEKDNNFVQPVSRAER